MSNEFQNKLKQEFEKIAIPVLVTDALKEVAGETVEILSKPSLGDVIVTMKDPISEAIKNIPPPKKKEINNDFSKTVEKPGEDTKTEEASTDRIGKLEKGLSTLELSPEKTEEVAKPKKDRFFRRQQRALRKLRL